MKRSDCSRISLDSSQVSQLSHGTQHHACMVRLAHFLWSVLYFPFTLSIYWQVSMETRERERQRKTLMNGVCSLTLVESAVLF